MYLARKIPQRDELKNLVGHPNDWPFETAGAWGKLRHKQSGVSFDFTFNAYSLDDTAPYTLVAVENPVVGAHPWCIGSGLTDSRGNLTLKGSAFFGGPGEYHAWLWLVRPSDITLGCNDFSVIAPFEPEEYLFAYKPITFTQTIP